jgi:hypothetical protein
MLDLNQVGDYFDAHFTRTAFRLEALDAYDVETDGEDFARYLSGEGEPNADYKSGWLKQLRDDTAAGKQWSRVHVLATPLNGYLRYECEWGYAYNISAGEQVGIIDFSEQELPGDVILDEFWLFDDEHLLLMHYDEAGHFVGGEPLPADDLPRYRAAMKAATDVAVPFTDWWARHPEEHRANWAV